MTFSAELTKAKSAINKVLLCDPPWQFRCYSPRGMGKSAERHYNTLSQNEIIRLVSDIKLAPDCVLFLWVTDPMLEHGLDLINQMGFTYKTVAFTWIKKTRHGRDHVGMGYYTRANPEMCLLATRGKVLPRKSKSVRQLLVSPLREHSRKPDEVYERIEALFDGPYVEMFARTQRNNWHCIGDQVGKFS